MEYALALLILVLVVALVVSGPLRPNAPDPERVEDERRATLEAAREHAPYAIGFVHVEGFGDPSAFVRSYPPGTVTLVYGDPARPRLVLTQFEARIERQYAQKLAGSGTRVEQAHVDGTPAVWLAGEPHVFAFTTPSGSFIEETLYLARNTLVWQDGAVTLRIEGDFSKADAIRIAESVD